MRSTELAVDVPQLAWLIPAILVVPFLSVLTFAVVLNWRR